MPGKKRVYQFLVWRARHISNKQLILLLSVAMGLVGGFAAVSLKVSVHFIQQLLEDWLPSLGLGGYLTLVLPMAGILLTVWFKRYFIGHEIGHGIPELLYSIGKRAGVVRPYHGYAHMVGSSLTVGLGGSVGLEAPIVTTGASLGSIVGRFFHLDARKRNLLMGCGAAAAIGGIFNSPIAGVVFTLEVLLLELAVSAYIPLLISSVTGTLVSKILLGNAILFTNVHIDPFQLPNIPYYLLLAVFTGLISVYFVRAYMGIEEWVWKIEDRYRRIALSGLAIGLLVWVFPPLYGEGYDTLQALLKGEPVRMWGDFFGLGDMSPLAMAGVSLLILVVKVAASAFTIGAGGNGGVFAPTMFIGGLAGFALATVVNEFFLSSIPLSISHFMLVGMAGVMSGVLHAPLTALFLIAEITAGYELILPLMLVSAISYATNSFFERHSIYHKKLAARGDLTMHDSDKTVLNIMRIEPLVEREFYRVFVDGSLRDLTVAVAHSHRNMFPVVDKLGLFKGIVLLDDFRHLMFKPDRYDDIQIRDLMQMPSALVHEHESMEEVMEKFDRTGNWNLPVVDDEKRYVGFVSKSKIFNHYRTMLRRRARETSDIIE
jgi:CIC family chloride channel protein